MALSVIKTVGQTQQHDEFKKYCLADLNLPPEKYPERYIKSYLELRLELAKEHIALGPPAEDDSYKKQLDFLNHRLKELGLTEHSQAMLPPVVFSDPALPAASSYYPYKTGYKLVNSQEGSREHEHMHEMTHAASAQTYNLRVIDDILRVQLVKSGCLLMRNDVPIFSIFNEYAAISIEEDYKKNSGAFNKNVRIIEYPFLNKEEKEKLLPLSRLVDAEGHKGIRGKITGWFRRFVSGSKDYSMDFKATVYNNSWPHSDYLTVYTAVNYMLLEVGANNLNLEHKYRLSKKQEKTILSNYKDEIQTAAFTGSIKKVAIDFKNTFGKRALHFLSDVTVSSKSDQAHLYLVMLFARAGHIRDPERRNLVREKIMDHYYDSKKASS